jgi:double zinc ribbon protein
MTSSAPVSCSACGAAGEGRFCSSCGTPRAGVSCPSCGKTLSPAARFCSGCGRGVGAAGSAPARGRTPWIFAGAALAGLLAVILVVLARGSTRPAAAESADLPAQAAPAETPPDISQMTPRERFNRLYNRVMQAAQSGDQATVTRFTPMALGAYAQLDTTDADARFHAALLQVHTGDLNTPAALADSILAGNPGHLFGYIVRGTVARFRKDEKVLGESYTGFLKHYDAEMKANRPEYEEHRTSVENFRTAALESRKKPG